MGSALEIVLCHLNVGELPVDIALGPGSRDRPGQVAAVRDTG